jgi:hypothetical protein
MSVLYFEGLGSDWRIRGSRAVVSCDLVSREVWKAGELWKH